MTGTNALGPIPQSAFLLRLGLQARLQKLMDTATTSERKDDIRKGATRLIDALGMGSQYQVMGITTTEPEVEVYPFPLPGDMPPVLQRNPEEHADTGGKELEAKPDIKA